MADLPELLEWLAIGGALDAHDVARYHDALALKLDADRHLLGELERVLADPSLPAAA